jgi:hypothetical protein
VLAVSQNQVRLFRATRHTIAAVETKGMPEDLAEVLRYDDPESQLQFRTARPGSPRDSAVFHGHSEEQQDAGAKLKRYFSAIDEGFQRLVDPPGSPLVVAAVDYLHPIYHEAAAYSHLMGKGIRGNPDHLSEQVLHERAWEVVAPTFRQERERAAATVRNRLGTGRASNQLAEIMRAAHYGRIQQLFVAGDTEQWGIYKPENAELELHAERKPGDEDLLNLASIQTTLHGGQVYLTKRGQAQHEGAEWPAAANFRY